MGSDNEELDYRDLLASKKSAFSPKIIGEVRKAIEFVDKYLSGEMSYDAVSEQLETISDTVENIEIDETLSGSIPEEDVSERVDVLALYMTIYETEKVPEQRQTLVDERNSLAFDAGLA